MCSPASWLLLLDLPGYSETSSDPPILISRCFRVNCSVRATLDFQPFVFRFLPPYGVTRYHSAPNGTCARCGPFGRLPADYRSALRSHRCLAAPMFACDVPAAHAQRAVLH